MKDFPVKSEARFKYKQCRNLLSALLKRSKQSYLTNYFQTIINDLKITWKGIKNLKSFESSLNSVPSAFIKSNISLVNLQEIANAFNK